MDQIPSRTWLKLNLPRASAQQQPMALDEFLVSGGQCEVAEPGAAHQPLEDIGDVELVVVPLQAVLGGSLAAAAATCRHFCLLHSGNNLNVALIIKY